MYRNKRIKKLKTRIVNGYHQYHNGKTWIWTHRRVAEKKMGSKILPGYEVHHINGNKRDNRPKNLVVLSKKAHMKLHKRSW